MNYILFGAGSAGRYAVRHLVSKGIHPCGFADNDTSKWGCGIEGLRVEGPTTCHKMYPEATWVATAISRPAAPEIRKQIKEMGVKTAPLWEVLPVCHGLPPKAVQKTIAHLLNDKESLEEWCDQYVFREQPDYDLQRGPSPKEEIYFPDFITHLDGEHFIDCGAADGDTVKEFRKLWTDYGSIIAFEPDPSNYKTLAEGNLHDGRMLAIKAAICDHKDTVSFAANGDYSSHIGAGSTKVQTYTLDGLNLDPIPTYIKMDIESSELEALWGARHLLYEHKPVLAICAYHTSEHLWQIPLLIHAIQPEYRLFLRRYAEGAFELVWYAVPPERVNK